MKTISRIFIFSIAIGLLGLNTGCSAVKTFQKYQQNKRDVAELKKSHYMALKHDIAVNELPNGMPGQDIKDKYGAPDDIFYSNSSGSSFQIWSYNMTIDKLDDTRFDPIILYLENDKLISWKY